LLTLYGRSMAVRVDILLVPGRGMWPTRLRPAVDAPAFRMPKGRKTMRSIGNLLWFILGGIWMGSAWWLIGLLV